MTRRELMKLFAIGGVGSLLGCKTAGLTPSAGARQLLGYVRTNWSRDPYAFGSYSYVSSSSPGTGEPDKRVVEAPIDERIYFAGEALNPNYGISVHAAHESGARVAKAVQATGKKSIAIVGAGMSGLTAARDLTRRGANVTVIEARDRIGGRVFTDRSLGTAVDLGATWIHGPDGNPLTVLADEAGMQRVETGDSYVVRGAGGRKISDLSVPRWISEVAEQTALGVEAEKLNEAYFNEVFPEYGIGYEGRDVKFPNGYDQIFDALKADYELVLSSPVERIVSTEAGVRIEISGAPARDFDAVIVTVSLGVLKKGSISFEPPLPEEKLAAISRMGMGVLDKLYLRYDRVFWDRDATNILIVDTGLPQGQFNSWLNLYPYFGEPILLAFNAASAALALADRTDDELVQMASSVLREAYPV